MMYDVAMPDQFSRPQFAEMCRIVAEEVFEKRKPTAAYADRVAKLLYMTAAHESDHFRARRQYGFTETSTRGAFGLFQMEAATLADNLEYLQTRPGLRSNCENLLQSLVATDAALSVTLHRPMLLWLQKPMWDALAAILARVHYIRVTRVPVPHSSTERACYAKMHWNTMAGKATPADYAAAYNREFVKEIEQQ